MEPGVTPDDHAALVRYLTNPPRTYVPDPVVPTWTHPPAVQADQPAWDPMSDVEEWLLNVGSWQRVMLALIVLEFYEPAWRWFARQVDDDEARSAPTRAIAVLWRWIRAADDDRGPIVNELRPVRRGLEEAMRAADDFDADRRVADMLRQLYGFVAFLLLDMSGDIDELVGDETALFEDIVDVLSNLSPLDTTLPFWWQEVKRRFAFRDALTAELE